MKRISLLPLFIVSLFASSLYQCAQVMSPQGGPRDTIPPQLIIANPPQETRNFSGQKFSFVFDERIKLDQIQNELIITPRIDTEYDYQVKRNQLILTFEEPFKDSTTYTFNFRESIQDVTESNPTRENKFVFSTGNTLDSLSVEGVVTELFSRDSVESATVGLYVVGDTTTIFNGQPYYFTETEEDGTFSLQNIQDGAYRLYAFMDNNKNLQLDFKEEAYGFIEDTLYVTTDIADLNIPLFHVDARPLELLRALPSGQHFDFNYNKYITRYLITTPDTDQLIYTGFVKDHRSIRIYNTFDEIDSILTIIQAFDSLGYSTTDTAQVKFNESNRSEEFTFSVTPPSGSVVEPSFNGYITASPPILQINTDSIFLQYNTTRICCVPDSSLQLNLFRDTLYFSIHTQLADIDSVNAQTERTIQAQKDSLAAQTQAASQQPLTQKQQRDKSSQRTTTNAKGLNLYLGNSAIISATNDTLASRTIGYTLSTPEDYGVIIGTVETDYESYTIQLVNNQNEVVKAANSVSQFTFTGVDPGSYTIRVLIDADNDGQWSYGNILENRNPEPIYFYPETISIRANWQQQPKLSF
jgi:uncharacterized protein (DUF2141 family)